MLSTLPEQNAKMCWYAFLFGFITIMPLEAEMMSLSDFSILDGLSVSILQKRVM